MTLYNSSLRATAEKVESYCGKFYRNEKNGGLLVLMGNPGNGKTHLLNAIVRFCSAAAFRAFEDGRGETWANIPSVVSVHWPKVVADFKDQNYTVVTDLLESDLVAIDDIGSENDPSKNGCENFCRVLSAREKKFTVVTTNVPPEKWSSVLDARVGDRLMRNSTILNMFSIKSFSVNRPQPTHLATPGKLP